MKRLINTKYLTSARSKKKMIAYCEVNSELKVKTFDYIYLYSGYMFLNIQNYVIKSVLLLSS